MMAYNLCSRDVCYFCRSAAKQLLRQLNRSTCSGHNCLQPDKIHCCELLSRFFSAVTQPLLLHPIHQDSLFLFPDSLLSFSSRGNPTAGDLHFFERNRVFVLRYHAHSTFITRATASVVFVVDPLRLGLIRDNVAVR
jgi:hypothetical protein